MVAADANESHARRVRSFAKKQAVAPDKSPTISKLLERINPLLNPLSSKPRKESQVSEYKLNDATSMELRAVTKRKTNMRRLQRMLGGDADVSTIVD
jgi:hypothetical protein